MLMEKLHSEYAASATTILSRLRADTRLEHDALEELLNLMSAALTAQTYRQRLEQFYGFYAPLELALQKSLTETIDRFGNLNFSQTIHSVLEVRLNKTACLQRDLQYLGANPEALPRCDDLPPVDTQARVLGCLYVMEGATLGGRLITQHIQTTLEITPTTGGCFFEGYGCDTARMWRETQQLIVASAFDQTTETEIVKSAVRTFACLRRWCESMQKPKR